MSSIDIPYDILAADFPAGLSVYLTGFTLGMALLLARTFSITHDLVRVHAELNKVGNNVSPPLYLIFCIKLMFPHLACSQTAKNSASTKQTQELKAEIELLQQKVKAKETEIASVKKQAGQNATAYEELSGPVSLFSIGVAEVWSARN